MNKTANELKSELKANGIPTKNVSIRVERGCIRVGVKTWDVSVSAIERVIKKYEKIDRCHATGDILQGCNNFVFVEYAYSLQVPEQDFLMLESRSSGYRLSGLYWNGIEFFSKEERHLFPQYNHLSERDFETFCARVVEKSKILQSVLGGN